MSNAITKYDDLDTVTLGRVLAKSGYFADARDEAQAIVKVLAGRELGFGPIASMTGIHIINGKPSVGAHLIAAAIKRRRPEYNYKILEMTDEVCSIAFYEHGDESGISTFTVADAKKAGTKNLDKFPRNMLFARALSNGARWYCPDIFDAPIYTPEEMGANVDGNGQVIVQAQPVRVVESEPDEPEPTPPPRKPEVTPEQAAAYFWQRFETPLGGREWGLVQQLTGIEVHEPATVEGWRMAWKATEDALAAEANNLAR